MLLLLRQNGQEGSRLLNLREVTVSKEQNAPSPELWWMWGTFARTLVNVTEVLVNMVLSVRQSSPNFGWRRTHTAGTLWNLPDKRGRQKGVCSDLFWKHIGTNRKKSEQIGTDRGIPENKERKSEEVVEEIGVYRNKSLKQGAWIGTNRNLPTPNWGLWFRGNGCICLDREAALFSRFYGQNDFMDIWALVGLRTQT